jgi:CRISPR/Cas system-associated exonuclease Cas4 (RecB family)
MTGFIDRVKMTLEYFYHPRSIRYFYRHGITGSKYGGYIGGRIARRRAVAKRIRRLQEKIDKADTELQALDKEIADLRGEALPSLENAK